MSIKLGISGGAAAAGSPRGGQALPGDEIPFTAFNFKVEINFDGLRNGSPLCQAAFAECDGLEVGMEIKTIRQGGDNTRQIHLPGPSTYGQLTLKRGMTTSWDLWDWVTATAAPGGLAGRASVTVTLMASSGSGGAMGGGEKTPFAVFLLERCLPTKMRAPSLNAKDGMLAVEELQLAYERLTRKKQ